MKKLIVLSAILAAAVSCGCNKDDDARVVVIVYDGARWQEMYAGADPAQISPVTCKDSAATVELYKPGDEKASRAIISPFVWSHVEANGVMIGNRALNCPMKVDNCHEFSYPGYSEMVCGYPDDVRVNSNSVPANPNRNVFEAINEDARYAGAVKVFGSWEAMKSIFNEDRSGIEVNCGMQYIHREGARSAEQKVLDQICTGLDYVSGTMPDVLVHNYALADIKANHPKAVFIAYDGPDHFPHVGQYDKYLEAINRCDGYVKELYEYCESDPFYKGKTTYIITADHGRGEGEYWRHHGVANPGSGQTWIMAFGAGINPAGELSDKELVHEGQIASTIAAIAGVDFVPDNGVALDPIDFNNLK